jgi:hypothetical protein
MFQEFHLKHFLNIIQPGDLLLSSNQNLLSILNPSPIKHISVYFGKGILTELKRIKTNLLSNNKELLFLKTLNLFNFDIIIKEIDNYKKNITDDEYYVLDIQTSAFKIIEIKNFIKYKNEIYVYRPCINNPVLFSKWYLYFIGNKYSFFYTKGSRYCFESVISLLGHMYPDFPIIYFKTIPFNYYHFNSLSITENEKIKLILIYKFGYMLLL